MSVINQMLQDLDKRRVQPSGAVAAASEVRVLTPPRPPRVRTLRLVAILIAIIAVAAMVAWGALHFQPSSQPRASMQDVLASPFAAPSEITSSVPTTANVAPPQGEPSVIAPPAAVVSASTTPITLDRVVARAPAGPAPERAAKARSTVVPRPAPTSEPEPALTAAPTPPQTASASQASNSESIAPGSAPPRRTSKAAPAATGEAQIDKRSPELTPQQRAENDYRAGANLLNHDRQAEAQEKFKAALVHYPEHTGARQALFGLLLSAQQTVEAERVLTEALTLNARQPGFAMALARMQLDRRDVPGAVETLQTAESVAGNNATYFAFLAALLQRQDRHADAVERYRNALALAPTTGVWLMGMGISLQALNRTAEAQDAFSRAKASNALNAELLAFVDERLVQLQRR